jgi:hypothetical protein
MAKLSDTEKCYRNDLRGVAIHEAGHAIVARFFDLPVGTLSIDLANERAIGKSEIGCDEHLSTIERIAVRVAGVAAQNLFKCPTREWVGMSDYVRVGELVSNLGATRSLELRATGYQRAYDILRSRRHEALRVARRLIALRQIDFSTIRPPSTGVESRDAIRLM